MFDTDKDEFENEMINCWQDCNSRFAPSQEALDRWFEDFKSFPLYIIINAFKKHSINKKFSPAKAEIKEIILKGLSDVKNNNPTIIIHQQCYFRHCNNNADERVGENSWMCADHSTETYPLRFPDSSTSKVLKMAHHFEGEAKNLGFSREEYFKKNNPKMWESIMRDRGRPKERVGIAQKVFERQTEEERKAQHRNLEKVK